MIRNNSTSPPNSVGRPAYTPQYEYGSMSDGQNPPNADMLSTFSHNQSAQTSPGNSPRNPTDQITEDTPPYTPMPFPMPFTRNSFSATPPAYHSNQPTTTTLPALQDQSNLLEVCTPNQQYGSLTRSDILSRRENDDRSSTTFVEQSAKCLQGLSKCLACMCVNPCSSPSIYFPIIPACMVGGSIAIRYLVPNDDELPLNHVGPFLPYCALVVTIGFESFVMRGDRAINDTKAKFIRGAEYLIIGATFIGFSVANPGQ